MGFPFDADASQDTDSGPKNIPEGDYIFRVHQIPTHSITSTNRNMLTMKMIIDDGEYSGRGIRFNLVFIPKTEKAHSMTVKALKAFGLQYDGALDIEPSDFVDKPIKAHVRVKPDTFIPKGETAPVTVNKSEIGWFILDESDSQIQPERKSTSKVRDHDEVPF